MHNNTFSSRIGTALMAILIRLSSPHVPGAGFTPSHSVLEGA
ncbi:hypothetical protein [Variovorax sp. H27-G14]